MIFTVLLFSLLCDFVFSVPAPFNKFLSLHDKSFPWKLRGLYIQANCALKQRM